MTSPTTASYPVTIDISIFKDDFVVGGSSAKISKYSMAITADPKYARQDGQQSLRVATGSTVPCGITINVVEPNKKDTYIPVGVAFSVNGVPCTSLIDFPAGDVKQVVQNKVSSLYLVDHCLTPDGAFDLSVIVYQLSTKSLGIVDPGISHDSTMGTT